MYLPETHKEDFQTTKKMIIIIKKKIIKRKDVVKQVGIFTFNERT